VTGESIRGGEACRADAPLDQIPTLVRDVSALDFDQLLD